MTIITTTTKITIFVLYIHVLADALTSILAIFALIAREFWGLMWIDPVMGLIGAAVIMRWSYGLVCETSSILLDRTADRQTKLAIVNAIEEDSNNSVSDLHVWKIGQDRISAMVSLLSDRPQQPEYYKKLLAGIPSVSHLSIEVAVP